MTNPTADVVAVALATQLIAACTTLEQLSEALPLLTDLGPEVKEAWVKKTSEVIGGHADWRRRQHRDDLAALLDDGSFAVGR